MASSGYAGVATSFGNFPHTSSRSRVLKIAAHGEDSSDDNMSEVAAHFGVAFAVEASNRPHLLHAAQRSMGQWKHATAFYTDKLRLAGKEGRALQTQLFKTKVDSMAQSHISQETEKKLRAQLLAAERRSQHNTHGNAQAAETPAALPENSVARSFSGPTARDSLGNFLQILKGRPDYTPAQMVPYFRAFANIVHDEDVDAPEEAIIAHPLLLEAFNVLNSEDEDILSAAVGAILAAIDLCSAAGTMAEGYERLCEYLAEGVGNLARWMKHFSATATTGDLSQEAKAAAYAKLLGAAATAFMCPVHSFLKDELSEKLISGMVAVRVYPETSIAAEGALFWRILVEANEMAEDYAERWNLPAAEELSSSTEEQLQWLLSQLYKSAVLPEHLWAAKNTEEQATLLQRRGAIAEPLVEIVELFGFERTMEVLEGVCKECKAQKWGKWSPDEALLACVNMLHRASPPLAEIRFIFLFQRLWSMPLKGNLTATMLEMVTLYTPWVHAMAEEAPGEAAEILEDFSCFLNTEEAQAQQARAPKARSEASQELHSEDSSEYESESDPECSDPDASAADIIIIDADIITDVEAGTAPNPEDPEEVVPAPGMDTPFCRPCQSPLTGASNSRPSGAPRAAPPGFERQASEVAPATSTASTATPASQPAPMGASNGRPSGAPRAAPPGFERQAAEVAPTPMVEAPTCPPRQSLPTGASNSRLSGAPRAAPPGFERHSPQVAPASNTRASNSPPCQPPLTGANNSTPRGAPRGAPPGFEQTAAQVAPASNTGAFNSPPCQVPLTGASNGRPSGAPRAAPPGFERPAAKVGPATSMGAPTYAQCQPPLPKVSTQSRPSGAPRAAPPGFQRPAAKVAPVSISGGSTCPAREPTPTGFRQCRPSGAPRGAPPGFEPRATEAMPVATQDSLALQLDSSAAGSAPDATAAPTPFGQTTLSGAPPTAPLGSQRPEVQAVPLTRQDSLPFHMESSAAVSATDGDVMPTPFGQTTLSGAPSTAPPGSQCLEVQAVRLEHQDSLPSHMESSAAVSATGAGDVPTPCNGTPSGAPSTALLESQRPSVQAMPLTCQDSLPSQLETDSSAAGSSSANGVHIEPATPGTSDISSAEDSPQAEVGLIQQNARAPADASASAPSRGRKSPGSFAGKLFRAAGAVVRTIEGFSRFLVEMPLRA